MGNWTQGFSAMDDAEKLREQEVKGSEALLTAARAAAADLIESGALGEGVHDVSISGNNDSPAASSLTISITTRPTTS